MAPIRRSQSLFFLEAKSMLPSFSASVFSSQRVLACFCLLSMSFLRESWAFFFAVSSSTIRSMMSSREYFRTSSCMEFLTPSLIIRNWIFSCSCFLAEINFLATSSTAALLGATTMIRGKVSLLEFFSVANRIWSTTPTMVLDLPVPGGPCRRLTWGVRGSVMAARPMLTILRF